MELFKAIAVRASNPKEKVTGDLEYGCRTLFAAYVTLGGLADCAL
jgi:hypothetical protein